MTDWFAEALARFPRIAITGGAQTGKTTICERVADRPVIHTDDFMKMEWSAVSKHVADLANATPGPLVIEGVRVPHALRKGMKVDAVIWLERGTAYARDGHEAQRAGVWTVFSDWRQSNPNVPVLLPAPVPLRNALPVQVWPK